MRGFLLDDTIQQHWNYCNHDLLLNKREAGSLQVFANNPGDEQATDEPTSPTAAKKANADEILLYRDFISQGSDLCSSIFAQSELLDCISVRVA